MSNISGRLLLVLVAEDGTSKMLFPDPRINNGDSSVAAMKETVVPGAAGATIQFDQQPGTERLLALVSSDDGFNQLGIDWQKRTFDADETRLLYQKLNHTTGSKGLTVEVDDQSPATYTVADCPVPPGAAKVWTWLRPGVRIHRALPRHRRFTRRFGCLQAVTVSRDDSRRGDRPPDSGSATVLQSHPCDGWPTARGQSTRGGRQRRLGSNRRRGMGPISIRQKE